MCIASVKTFLAFSLGGSAQAVFLFASELLTLHGLGSSDSLFFIFPFFSRNVKVVYNSCHRATPFKYSNDINNLRAIRSLFIRPILVAYIIVVEMKNRNVPTAAGARIGMFSCTDDTGVFLFVLRSAFPASSENTEQHAFLWVLRAGMG